MERQEDLTILVKGNNIAWAALVALEGQLTAQILSFQLKLLSFLIKRPINSSYLETGYS